MRVACVMMQKNETDLLGPWVAYHGDLFGIENLFIFDNGSTDLQVLKIESELQNRGLSVDYSKCGPEHFLNKGDIIGEKIRSLDLLRIYDFFIPLDCDEFVAVWDEGMPRPTCEQNIIFKELSKYLQEEKVLSVESCLANVPGEPENFCHWRYKKVFFGKDTFERMDRGFHGGVSKKTSGSRATKLIYVHMHHKKYSTLIAHSKEKLSKYVSITNPESLVDYRGNGWHLVKYLTMSEDQYIQRFESEPRIHFPEFANCLKNFGMPVTGAEV